MTTLPVLCLHSTALQLYDNIVEKQRTCDCNITEELQSPSRLGTTKTSEFPGHTHSENSFHSTSMLCMLYTYR